LGGREGWPAAGERMRAALISLQAEQPVSKSDVYNEWAVCTSRKSSQEVKV
jgi:hypothetical protein